MQTKTKLGHNAIAVQAHCIYK